MKLIIRDLELGKSYKKQLVITNQNVDLLENKVKIKDNIISSLNQKEVNYKSIIENKDQILIEKNTIIVGISQEKTNLQLKLFRSRLTTVVLVPLAVGITYFLVK
jgi:cystathionine beta-lyase family protein involved in aluminum resistance